MKHWRYLVASTILCCAVSLDAAAFDVAPPSKEEPVLLKADKLGYDSMSEIVVASGNVEVVQGDYVLQAQRITYYKNQNKVKASGNVVLMEPSGNVAFAENMELSNNLKDGLISHFKVTMADKSRFAAVEARRTNAKKISLKQGVYSPCPVCLEKDGSEGAPLWQIKAKKIKVDELDQYVTYKNAWMEMWGVPVAYTPYFRHPTPGADPKFGLLMPTYEQGQLGTTLKTPVFIPIARDKDMTLTPFLTSQEGPVLEGEYRQRTDDGMFQFNGSITNPHDRDATGKPLDKRNIRGHLFAKGNQGISDHWSWGFDANRSSDDTYLRRYGYGNHDLLTSNVYADRIEGRNMVRIEGVAFQGLEVNDNPDAEPYALPSITAYLESEPLSLGSRAYVDMDTLTLSRKLGSEYRRVSSTVGMKLPHTTPTGHVVQADMSVRGDAYNVSDVTREDGSNYNGQATRAIPQASLAWSYPLVKQVNNASLIVEPVAMAVARSTGNNTDKIPNMDSLNAEFSDINVFSSDRFAGLDRAENGSHLVYGMNTRLQLQGDTHVSMMAGQDHRLSGENSFPLSHSGDEDLSDIVGRIAMHTTMFDLAYRYRLDQQDMSFIRSEVNAGINADPLALQTDYIRVADDPTGTEREEVAASGNLTLTQQWALQAFGQRDIVRDRMVAAGGGLVYTHDCITVLTEFRREFIRDRDVEPNSSVSVKLSLKNLN